MVKYVVIIGSPWRSNEPQAAIGPFDTVEQANAEWERVSDADRPGPVRADGLYAVVPIGTLEELAAIQHEEGISAINEPEEPENDAGQEP